MKSSAPFSLRTTVIYLILAAVVSTTILALQASLIGKRPTMTYSPQSHGGTEKAQPYTDPTLVRLQQATKASPNDFKTWKAYALALSDKLQKGEIEPKQGALDLVDSLSHVLKLNENDTDAILLTADLSFDLRAFTKAKEFYERYFTLVPKDNVAAARYASTLTFLGKFHEATSILQDIIDDEPTNFQAHAFLAIAYAQRGEIKEAREKGKAALALAPSDEARARFEQFLNGLGKEQPADPPLYRALKTNPIAGQKVVSLEANGTTLTATMRDFPMHLMPPMAKQSFLRTLTGNRGAFDTITFIDMETKEILGTFSLQEESDKTTR